MPRASKTKTPRVRRCGQLEAEAAALGESVGVSASGQALGLHGPQPYAWRSQARLLTSRDEVDVASVVAGRRNGHPTHVFAYRGKPITRMQTRAWLRARRVAGLPQARVHDLGHNTFGRRLRAAGGSSEDRQDLLAHRSGRITTHDSAANLSRLFVSTAANRVCARRHGPPELVVLRRASAA